LPFFNIFVKQKINNMKKLFALLLITGIIFSCKKKEDEPTPEETPIATASEDGYPDTVWAATGTGPRLIFKFKFDSTQARLDAFGNPLNTIPSGHSAYSPKFNQMAAHYIELAQGDLTALGDGQVLYHAPETALGGTTAIQFSKSVVVRENVAFYSIPLSQVAAGTYKWLRLSLSYQNYDIPYKANALTTPGNIGTGTVASFLGYKTYVTKYKIKDQDYIPSANVGGPNVNHAQGYWGFETNIPGYGYWKSDGQSPSGSTTVVNPNFANSPIPAGSCVVTALFSDMSSTNQALTITGSETQDIIVTVSLSTNKSFEFVDPNGDGYYQPENLNEWPVDMGIRGMIPKVQY
jgi:hypothetical protein